MDDQKVEPIRAPDRITAPKSFPEPGQSSGHFTMAQYLDTLIRRKWLIVSTVLLLVGGAGAYSWWATPMYEALSLVEIQPASASSSEANQVLAMVVEPGRALQTQIELIKSKAVLDPAAKDLRIKEPFELEESLSVKLLTGTQIVEIRVKHPDRDRASEWANAVADSYIDFRRNRVREVTFAVSENIDQRIQAAKAGLDQINRQLRENPTGPSVEPERQSLMAQLNALQADLITRLTALEIRLAELPDPEHLSRGSGVKISAAETPEDPISPDVKANLAWGAILGVALGVALALTVEGMSGRMSETRAAL